MDIQNLLAAGSNSWEIITGFFLPLVTAFILQLQWSTQAKAAVSFAFMLLVAFVGAKINGLVNANDILGSVVTVLVIAITSFKALWQPTGIARGIESATTVNHDAEK